MLEYYYNTDLKLRWALTVIFQRVDFFKIFNEDENPLKANVLIIIQNPKKTPNFKIWIFFFGGGGTCLNLPSILDTPMGDVH